jgi:uncharacterized protein (TIGR02246 family)
MKCKVALAVLVVCATPARAEEKKMSPDDSAILAVHEEFGKVWSAGDTDRLATFFTEDGVRVGAAGDISRGRAEIKAAYDRLLQGPFKGAKVTIDRGSVRALSKDISLWQGAIEIDPGGGKPPIRGYVVEVMKKVSGKWLILESHPKIFPPPPPGAK